MNLNCFGEQQQAPSEPRPLSEPSSTLTAMNLAPVASSLDASRAEQQKPQPERLAEKRVLGPNDVLSGRTKLSFNHIGNRRFREVVAQSIDDYNSAPSRAERYSIIDMVIAQVANAEGRFLKLDDATQEWEEVEHDVVRQKISHAIRDTTKKREAKKQRGILRSEKAAAAAAAAKVGMSEHHCADPVRNSFHRKQHHHHHHQTAATPGPMAVTSSNAKPVAPISDLMQNLNAYMQGGSYAARVASAKANKKKSHVYSTTNGIPMDATPAFLQHSGNHSHVMKHPPNLSNQRCASDSPGFGMTARPKLELRPDGMDDMPFHPTCATSTGMMDESMAEPTRTRFELRQDVDVCMAPCVSMGDDMLDPTMMMRPAGPESRYQHAQPLDPAAAGMGVQVSPFSLSQNNHTHPSEDHTPVAHDDGFLSIINDTLGAWQPETDPFL